MRKHFVQFLSPGTFVSETTTKPIEDWDVVEACRLAKSIEERHGAKPYGFEFITKLVGEAVDDGEGGKLEVMPREVERSGTYFITGDLLFYHKATGHDLRILRENMRCNRCPVCIENGNSYRHTSQFNESDCIVDWDGSVIRRGTDADLIEYRETAIAEWEAARSVASN